MTTTTALDLLSTNVNVGMNEIVSVFVSQYEDQLFDKKANLSSQITKMKKELSDIDGDIIKTVNVDSYRHIVPGLNMYFEHRSTEVNWTQIYGDNKINTIKVNVGLYDGDNNNRNVHTQVKVLPIPEHFIKLKKELQSQVDALSAELVSVLNDIKSVSRKERQIRGKLSEMKLAESGYSDLLINPELVKLIQV